MSTRLFDWLGYLAVSRPRVVLTLYAIALLVALALLLRLDLATDMRNTLPPDMARALERHNALFGTADLAFLLVQTSTGGRDTLLAFGAALHERLTTSPLIRRVEYGYAPEMLAVLDRVSLEYAPFFVTPAQLDDFDQLLTPPGIQAQLHKTVLQLSAMSTGPQDQWLVTDPLQLRRFAFARLVALRGTFRFDPTSPYFLSPDGTALLIKIAGWRPVHDMTGARATVALIEQTSATLRAQAAFQGLMVQATGGYYFATESERVIRHDIIVSVPCTIVSVGALITWSLRRWGVLLYGILPTLLSLVLALGLFAALRPRLNALTLGCIASLIGFGIDFSLHVLQRAFNEQGRGCCRVESLRIAVGHTGGALLLAALTSMTSFLAFQAASQSFLHDLGVLAALSMGLSCLLSATFLPALLVLLPQPRRLRPPRTLGLPTLIAAIARCARLILVLSLLLSLGALAALFYWPPRFETDLRNIHAAPSPTLHVQETIAALFGGSQEPLLLLVEDATEGQVMQALHRLQPTLTAMVQEGLLAAATSPAMLYPDPSTQTAVLQRVQTKDLQQLRTTLSTGLAAAGFAAPTIQEYVDRFQRTLSHRTPIDLAAFRALGFDALLQPLLAHDAAGAVGVAVLFPTHNLWTLAARDAITQRLTTTLTTYGIHGTLSGLYTVSSAATALLSADFVRITLLAVLGVTLVVSLHMRRLQLSAMVLLPIGCGTLWAAGFFALCGFKLNFMTICILPMLLATSSDYGIYIVHRFTFHGRADMQDAMQVTGLGVILSALTTLEGFGTLALSVNRGIASVGLVSLVGISACLLAALCTLPATLQIWGAQHHNGEQG
ncbi:MAG TPA: MMPL family transporter [Candidatus Tectomicrobia bacterium]